MAEPTRREILASGVRGTALMALGGVLGAVAIGHADDSSVWQIDPSKCVQCGKCATQCVLNPSAVKCIHAHVLCGYCKLCTGYFDAQPNALNTGAENQLCPTGAIKRKLIEGDYYEYHVAADECIGCARCVKGCNTFGNGSLYMQIDQDLCVRCNQCSIAQVCPSQAISRIPRSQSYLLKAKPRGS